MSKEAIISLALLKVNWDKYQKSYTDNFAPLAAECIRKSGATVISLEELRANMLSEFGLRIPTHSLKVVLERLKKKGMLKQDHGAYLPVLEKLEKLSIEETRRKVLKEHEATVINLIDYCRDSCGVVWNEKQAEDALISYLKLYDLDILLSTTEGTPLPQVEQPVRNAKFLVNAFVREVAQHNPLAFQYFETIVKGHLLANALVFPEIAEIARRFVRTKVFFDTRPILSSLGYRGTQYRQASRDLLELLDETGADLRCFRHTREEIDGILNACARAARSESTIPTSFRLEFPNSSESDVLLALATLDRDLQRLRLRIEDKPEYAANYQISEIDLDALLQLRIGYTHEHARIRDVDSLSAIYRLRQGRQYNCIEECRAIFVTTNSSLVHSAADFFATYQNRTSTPICITEHHLTNILWLKKPMLVPGLPRKQMMADAFAAMEPSADLWKRFVHEVDKLKNRGNISAEEYLLLRNSIEVRHHLMNVTLGDEEAVAEGTVEDVLSAYNANLIADAAAKQQKAEAKGRVLEEDLDMVRQRIENVAASIAAAVGWCLLIALAGVLISGALSPFFGSGSVGLLRCSLSVSAFLLASAGTLSLIRGGTVKSVSRRTEAKVRRFLTRLFNRLILGNSA